mgnify:CR=1 FL=1
MGVEGGLTIFVGSPSWISVSACVTKKGGGLDSPTLNGEVCVAVVGVGGWLSQGCGIEQQGEAIEGQLVASGDPVVR